MRTSENQFDTDELTGLLQNMPIKILIYLCPQKFIQFIELATQPRVGMANNRRFQSMLVTEDSTVCLYTEQNDTRGIHYVNMLSEAPLLKFYRKKSRLKK